MKEICKNCEHYQVKWLDNLKENFSYCDTLWSNQEDELPVREYDFCSMFYKEKKE